MKNIFILGAGGFGREIHVWLTDWCALRDDWKIVGFIDDDLAALASYRDLPPVKSSVEEYTHSPRNYVVCALGDPLIKKKNTERLESKGVQFLSFQHPSAIVGPRVQVGLGAVICPNVVLTTDIQIGKFVTLNVASSVGHDADIGDFSTLSAHCDVTGGAKLEDCVFMGSHSVILPKTYVGRGAYIGAGSVVMKTVKPNTRVFGVPAKRISV